MAVARRSHPPKARRFAAFAEGRPEGHHPAVT
jgi:hypothetical protein